MTIDTFKKLAAIVEERNFQVGLDTKKHMIDILASFDEDGQINYDEDCHWTIYVDETCYTDEEITPALLKKACYIEFSWGDGWAFYIGRNCTPTVLESAFENTLNWALECGAEFGELTNAQLDIIEECGIELEFAARNREWNAEAEAEVEAEAEAEVEAEAEAEVEVEVEEIQVVIYAADKYINTTVKTVDEARALKDQYRAQIQSYDRWNFKAYNPKIVKFDRWGDIIEGAIEV